MAKTESSQSLSFLAQAVHFLRRKMPVGFKPEIAIVLGSGLADLVQAVQKPRMIPYSQIPGTLPLGVPGHRGELVLGEMSGKKVMVFSGRKHYYEGVPMSVVTYPLRLAARLGVQKIILTSAVGAVNPRYRIGDIVVIRDHLNFMGANPLRGAHDPSFGARFPDLSGCYGLSLQKLAVAAAKKLKIRTQSGIYCAVIGPSYETPAEIQAFGRLGADVVGMSVVPEAIVSRQMNLEVLALSHVSNMASGISKQRLNHGEVLEAGKASGRSFTNLISQILKSL